MKTYIRVVENTIAEIVKLEDAQDINQLYHPDVVKLFTVTAKPVEVGYILEDGNWVKPPVVEPPPLPQEPTQQ